MKSIQEEEVKSIRAFIGAKDFQLSRAFYTDFGFKESIIAENMSYFQLGVFGFYLQKAYVKDWVDNTMLFLEVKDLPSIHKKIEALHLKDKYPTVRISNIQYNDWGNEFFVHDPSGILWHIGNFK